MNIVCPTPGCWAVADNAWLEDDGRFTCSHCGETLAPADFGKLLEETIARHEAEVIRLRGLLEAHEAKRVCWGG